MNLWFVVVVVELLSCLFFLLFTFCLSANFGLFSVVYWIALVFFFFVNYCSQFLLLLNICPFFFVVFWLSANLSLFFVVYWIALMCTFFFVNYYSQFLLLLNFYCSLVFFFFVLQRSRFGILSIDNIVYS